MRSGSTTSRSSAGIRRATLPGFTLMEVIVGAALLVLMAALLVQLLVPTLRAAARGAVRVEMEQRALVALSRLASDLEESAPGAVAIHATPGGPVYIGAFRLAGVDSDGAKTWSREAVVWGWNGKGKPLERKIWQPGGRPVISLAPLAERAQRLSRGDIAAIVEEQALPGAALAKDVIDFTITDGEGNSVAVGVPPLLVVTVRLRKEAATGRRAPEEYEYSRSIVLRNGI